MPITSESHRVAIGVFYPKLTLILWRKLPVNKWRKCGKRRHTFNNTVREQFSCLMCLSLLVVYFLTVLLLNSCMDIELNPGPCETNCKTFAQVAQKEIEVRFQQFLDCFHHQCTTLSRKIDESINRVEQTLKSIVEDVHTLKKNVQEDQSNIRKLQQDSSETITRLDRLEQDIQRLDTLSRQANLKFIGIYETNPRENRSDIDELVTTLNHYSTGKTWSNSDFERTHRIGQWNRRRQYDQPRPLIVTLCNTEDKLCILQNREFRERLRRDGIRVTTDLTQRQRETMQYYRNQGHTAFYKNGKLHVENNNYTQRKSDTGFHQSHSDTNNNSVSGSQLDHRHSHHGAQHRSERRIQHSDNHGHQHHQNNVSWQVHDENSDKYHPHQFDSVYHDSCVNQQHEHHRDQNSYHANYNDFSMDQHSEEPRDYNTHLNSYNDYHSTHHSDDVDYRSCQHNDYRDEQRSARDHRNQPVYHQNEHSNSQHTRRDQQRFQQPNDRRVIATQEDGRLQRQCSQDDSHLPRRHEGKNQPSDYNEEGNRQCSWTYEQYPYWVSWNNWNVVSSPHNAQPPARNQYANDCVSTSSTDQRRNCLIVISPPSHDDHGASHPASPHDITPSTTHPAEGNTGDNCISSHSPSTFTENVYSDVTSDITNPANSHTESADHSQRQGHPDPQMTTEPAVQQDSQPSEPTSDAEQPQQSDIAPEQRPNFLAQDSQGNDEVQGLSPHQPYTPHQKPPDRVVYEQQLKATDQHQHQQEVAAQRQEFQQTMDKQHQHPTSTGHQSETNVSENQQQTLPVNPGERTYADIAKSPPHFHPPASPLNHTPRETTSNPPTETEKPPLSARKSRPAKSQLNNRSKSTPGAMKTRSKSQSGTGSTQQTNLDAWKTSTGSK